MTTILLPTETAQGLKERIRRDAFHDTPVWRRILASLDAEPGDGGVLCSLRPQDAAVLEWWSSALADHSISRALAAAFCDAFRD